MIELLNIDCMDYMAGLKDKAFELAIVDPPYGIGVNNMSMFDGAKKQRRHKEYKDEPPTIKYFTELFRVSINQIIWGGNYFHLPPTKCVLIWDKIQEFSGADFEMAWTSFNTPAKAFRQCRAQAYGMGTIHPTQKPIKLYRWLLHNYAKPGDRILDTHGGSMSSAIACHNMGFDMVLCEIDKDYYDAGLKRYNNAIMQQKLFI